MKKQLFRWLGAITLTVLTLVFAGCGSSGSSDSNAPAKPTAVAATAADSQVAVTWTASADATSYNVYYGTNPGVNAGNGTKVAGATSGQAITPLVNGTTYYFVVTAVGTHGESAVSDEAVATPLPPLPAKVQGVMPTGGDGQVTLAWSNVTGATSYNLYWSSSNDGTVPTGATKVTGAASGMTVAGLTNGVPYYFVVTAENLAGEGPVSSLKSATPAAVLQPPASPTGVSVSAGTGQVTVSWAAPPLADSYNVYYLQSASTPTTASVLASGTKVPAAASPQVVSGLTAGANYWFIVTAVNAAGESGGQGTPKKAVPL